MQMTREGNRKLVMVCGASVILPIFGPVRSIWTLLRLDPGLRVV